MLQILVCDDDFKFMETLRLHVDEYMKSHLIECKIVAATDPFSIAASDRRFDIAFLDIRMDEMDGLSLAKTLRLRNEKLVLFFVTSYGEYQDDAMDLRALRYFPKPFDPDRLYRGLDRAMEYVGETYVDFYLRQGGSYRKIPVDSIMYVTIENRKALLHTESGLLYSDDEYESLCSKISVAYFYRVHKSFFVNLHYVQKYSYSELFLTDGSRIPIATHRQAAFRKYWFKYLKR